MAMVLHLLVLLTQRTEMPKFCPEHSISCYQASGFTLVEILIALVITGICASVVLGKTSEASAHYRMLEERNYASWVAQNEIARYRLSSERLPTGGNSEIVEMGNRSWLVDSQVSESKFENLYKIVVEVRPEGTGNPNPNRFSMTGFLSQADK